MTAGPQLLVSCKAPGRCAKWWLNGYHLRTAAPRIAKGLTSWVLVLMCLWWVAATCQEPLARAIDALRSWVNARPNDGLTTLECRLFADFFRCSVLSYDFSRRLEWNNMPSWAGVRKCSGKKKHANYCPAWQWNPNAMQRAQASCSRQWQCDKAKEKIFSGWWWLLQSCNGNHWTAWKLEGHLVETRQTSDISQAAINLQDCTWSVPDFPIFRHDFAMICPIFCHGNLPCSMLQTAACWLATMEASCSATFEDHKWSSNLLGWPRRFTNELILVVCM